MTDVLDSLGTREMAPAFIMIDPFGAKGVPLELVRRLASFPRTELLISFMYEPVTRWLRTPEFAPHLDALFGARKWRDAAELDSAGRQRFLHDLYISQLRDAGMKYVRSFALKDEGNRLEYFLMFATHHIAGLEAIKDAMWTVNPSGAYEFSDYTSPDPAQRTLFSVEPDYQQLRQLLVGRFGAATVPVDEIDTYVLTETAFRKSNLRRRVLRPLEEDGQLAVLSERKRRFSYPPGTLLRFNEPGEDGS